ncbi:MAG: EAL domain-containing protein [Chloroflexota bacterium]|nr:EAL domain-containing protein [Chloroflexota bacterium]
MRFFSPQQRHIDDERLIWSRDIRFANRIAEALPEAHVLELESGTAIIASSEELTESFVAEIARSARNPAYGLVMIDPALPEADRYVVALSSAVQLSGLADRIGMAQSTQLVQTKTLDYFFNLRNRHAVQFQPIVELATGELHEYECLFRPVMPMLPQSITAIVQAAIDTDRSIQLDAFIVRAILERSGGIQAVREATGQPPLRIAINLTPASLLDPQFEAKAFVAMVRTVGLSPRQITLECTEQQAVSDVVPLKRQVKALRRLGFGFAIDDAGAGYASFALIAALRPSVIKIDREIIHGLARDDAKQALVEAFVSFGRRIGARLLAEGIEKRADLAALKSLGVELGQGYLLGRPSPTPDAPRRLDIFRTEATGKAVAAAAARVSASGRRRTIATAAD